MPDYGDFVDDVSYSSDFVMWFLIAIFVFCIVATIIDKIKSYIENKKRKQIEDFYDILAESDLKTSYTCSDVDKD